MQDNLHNDGVSKSPSVEGMLAKEFVAQQPVANIHVENGEEALKGIMIGTFAQVLMMSVILGNGPGAERAMKTLLLAGEKKLVEKHRELVAQAVAASKVETPPAQTTLN